MENKKDKRIKRGNQVQITIPPDYNIRGSKRILYRLTNDISENGMKIISDTFIPKGILLKIRLDLKGSPRLIQIHGEVKWIRSIYSDERFEMGIKFRDMSPKDARILKKYIENCSVSV